jgi:tRNA(Arg) A34 adenosine deaminase TadA
LRTSDDLYAKEGLAPLFFCLTEEETPLHLSVQLSLPGWINHLGSLLSRRYPTDEGKMELAINLARRNVSEQTGGPFGAAIFNSSTGEVISVGVNRVVPLNNSTAHAEMMAFMLAQQRLKSYRLDATRHKFVLATSAQPCAMCYGACPWAGIHRLLVGARREDVETLTEFDEGPMPKNWVEGLTERGIRISRDILREEARAVFEEYQRSRGTAY